MTVADHEQRHLRAGEPLLDHKAPARVAEALARQVLAHRGRGLGARAGDQHAFACGEAVGLDDEEVAHGVEEGLGCGDVVKGAVARSGNTGSDQHVFHPRLGTFELCAVGTGPENRPALRPQPIGEAIDKRGLGADDDIGLAGEIFRIGEETALVAGVLVEDVDVLAEHLIRRNGQVLLDRLERRDGRGIDVANDQILVGEHEVRR